MQLDPGLRIGKYQLGKQLGQGGFGAVYVAHDTELDRAVAIKFLLPEHSANAQIMQRFLQEARSAAKIGHPGIVTVYESGHFEGTGTAADSSAYIVMELLRGETLGARLARTGRLTAAEAIDICWEVGSALDAAHAAGIIHRDLKPDNVFLMHDPAVAKGERVKVLDFGIAKLADTGGTSGVHTHTLMVFGTPRYMSPEQCKSSARIDQRSDIYSLGCILFELLAGRAPFVGDPGELLALQQLASPPTVMSLAPDVPPGLDALVTRMLEKDPARRPPTMIEVQATLRAPSTSEMAIAVPASTQPAMAAAAMASTLATATATEPPRRPRWWIAAVAGGVVAAGAVVAVVATRKTGGDVAPPGPDVGIALLGVITPEPRPIRAIDEAIVKRRSTPDLGEQIDRIKAQQADAGVAVADSQTSDTPTGRISVGQRQAFDESSLTPDIVLAKIQTAYMAGIKRCYKNYLARDASARGKVTLSLTVNPTGVTVNAKATGFAAAVDECITPLMAGWRFPMPKDKDGEATDASFAITLQLVPD